MNADEWSNHESSIVQLTPSANGIKQRAVSC